MISKYSTIRAMCICMLAMIIPVCVFSQQVVPVKWTHFSIDPILMGSSWGTGGPVLGDFDSDGDIDVAISRRTTEQAYWYQRINDSIWIPHVMGSSESLSNSLGAVSLDADRDGWMDVLFMDVWFRNPGSLAEDPDIPWQANSINAGGHDAVGADLNNDNIMELVIYDGHKLAWYDTQQNFLETIVDSGYNDHGGIAPGGIGDLDGDADPDLVIPGYWFSNPGNDSNHWIRYEWPYDSVPYASYGRSIRSYIADINNDGENDIVYSNCDTGGSHVYWVENMGGGLNWIVHRLPDPPVGLFDISGTGSFHSLGIADFNQDGYLDIFAGEQEDPDTYMESSGLVAMKPRGLKERGVIWYNRHGEQPAFSIDVFQINNPGWHDAQLADVDGDGDVDIVSKIWNADGLTYHADFWRNELINRKEME